jgi:hypothetical protein
MGEEVISPKGLNPYYPKEIFTLDKVPDYILRQALRPWGRRFPKRGPSVPWPMPNWTAKPFVASGEITKKCTTCGLGIYGGGVFKAEGTQYHFQCEPEYMPLRRTSWKEEIPKGNLEDSEYRFWVGSVAVSAGFSMCRACHKFVYTKHERIVHKGNVAEGAEPCTKRLTDAYKLLHPHNKCVVCEEQTFSQRWGVPLCQTRDCIRRFMFETSYWWQLEMALIGKDPERPKIVTGVGYFMGEDY